MKTLYFSESTTNFKLDCIFEIPNVKRYNIYVKYFRE